MSDARSLGAWMRRQAEGRAASARFELRQVVGGQGSAQVEAYEGPFKDQDWTALAESVLEAAQGDADAVGPGVFAYVVCALAGDRIAARRTFRVIARDDIGAAAGPAEAANAAGVLGQLMRHLESRERLQTAGELRVLSLYEKLLAKQEGRIEHLESREAEVLRMFESLIHRKHERDIELTRAKEDAAQRTMLTEKLSALIPHAGAKMGLLPAQGDAEVAALVEVIVKKEVPVEGLLGGLPPEAGILLASIIKRYLPAPPAKPEPEPKVN